MEKDTATAKAQVFEWKILNYFIWETLNNDSKKRLKINMWPSGSLRISLVTCAVAAVLFWILDYDDAILNYPHDLTQNMTVWNFESWI